MIRINDLNGKTTNCRLRVARNERILKRMFTYDRSANRIVTLLQGREYHSFACRVSHCANESDSVSKVNISAPIRTFCKRHK